MRKGVVSSAIDKTLKRDIIQIRWKKALFWIVFTRFGYRDVMSHIIYHSPHSSYRHTSLLSWFQDNQQRVIRFLFGFFLASTTALYLYFVTQLPIEGIFFVLYVFGAFWWKIPSRVSIATSLTLLTLLPFLFLAKQYEIIGTEWFERVGLWAYFFLLIGTAVYVWELKIMERPKPTNGHSNIHNVTWQHYSSLPKTKTSITTAAKKSPNHLPKTLDILRIKQSSLSVRKDW